MEEWITIPSLIINFVLASAVLIQLKIYRDEIKNRQRPWVGRRGQGIRIIPREGPHMPPRLIIPFENHGEMPARNVTFSGSVATGIPQNQPTFTHPERGIDYGPKETWEHRLFLNDNDFANAMNGRMSYALQCKYTDKDGLDGLYELRGSYINGVEQIDSATVR